jgi:hypothetical protein
MSTETSKLKPKADVIAQFRYSAEVQAIGAVEANGMVSVHGHDATQRGKRLPLIASDQDLNPERSPLFSFEVEEVIAALLIDLAGNAHRIDGWKATRPDFVWARWLFTTH